MKTLYVDVSATLASGLRTGIQRVVRRIAAELIAMDAAVVLVAALDGQFHALTADGMAALLRPPTDAAPETAGSSARARIGAIVAAIPALADRLQGWNFNRRIRGALLGHAHGAPVAFGPNSIVVMLDAFWGGTTSIAAAGRAKHAGASVAMVVYDLIPITHPETMDRMTALLFKRRLLRAAKTADMILAISRHCAEEVRALLGGGARRQVTSFELGSDIGAGRGPSPVGTARPWFNYLMVGTIEPRKGHRVVLDAFEMLWARGSTPRLLVVGKVGWADADLVARLRGHPRLGRELRMEERVSDAKLAVLMKEADALIMASSAEGFGLPIVEALAVGLPAIVSDIPVFREVAGDTALYFDQTDPASLVQAIRSFEEGADDWREKARAFGWIDWRTAAGRFHAKVIGAATPTAVAE